MADGPTHTMSETCITFQVGDIVARVLVEKEEVEHYAVQYHPYINVNGSPSFLWYPLSMSQKYKQ